MNEQDKVIILIALVLLFIGCVQEDIQQIQLTTNEDNETQSVSNESFAESGTTITGSPEVDLNQLEQRIHELINEERKENGLNELAWESDIASVAKRHSEDQAKYNEITTRRELFNPVPLIYHEGFEFGFYQDERLENLGVYDFVLSSENISIHTIIEEQYYETYGSEYFNYYTFPEIKRPWETQEEARERVLQEIMIAQELTRDDVEVHWVEIAYKTQEEMAIEIVEGWMGSPGHRENILTPSFDRTGIGVTKVNDWFISTQVFVETAECGYETGSCCKEVGYYPWCYEPLTCVSGVCVK